MRTRQLRPSLLDFARSGYAEASAFNNMLLVVLADDDIEIDWPALDTESWIL